MLDTNALFQITDVKKAVNEAAGSSPNRAVNAGRSQGTIDGDVRWLPVDEIYPMGLGEIHNAENPMPWFENPRDASELSDESIAELAARIENEGQQTPVFVRPIARGYQLFDGERRLNATKLLNRDKILARVFDDIDEVEAMERAIIGETQKKTWSHLAQARAYVALQKTMQYRVDQIWQEISKDGSISPHKINWTAVMSMWIDEPEWLQDAMDTARGRKNLPVVTFEAIALRVGVPARQISNAIQLLNSPKPIVESVAKGEIEPSKALIISRVQNPRKRNQILAQAVSENLSAEGIRREIAKSKPQSKITVSKARISAVEPLKIAVSSLLEATRAEFKPADREEKVRLINLAKRYVKQLETGVAEEE